MKNPGTMIKEWKEKRLPKRLGHAIINKDLDGIRSALKDGATQVDMTLTARAPYGSVPILKVFDPIELGRMSELGEEGMELLTKKLGEQPTRPSVDLVHKRSAP